MRIDTSTGHFGLVTRAAREHNARALAVQDFWTFVNFPDFDDAEAFLAAVTKAGKETFGYVNTQRGVPMDMDEADIDRTRFPYEVAVRHPM